MKRENRRVLYSYEHGDESLPHLKDLVSDTPDPEKGKIMNYLKTHCVLASPGAIRDEIDPEKYIGCGNVYSDGTYYWRDTLSMEEYKETMKGIYTTSVNEKTLDEAPMAYKSLEDIIDVVSESVDVIEVLKPIYNFKASE